MRADLPGGLLLDQRCQVASRHLDEAVCDLWHQCHCCIHSRGLCCRVRCSACEFTWAAASSPLQDYIYRHVFGQITPRALGSLAYSLVFVLVCFLPVWWMYRKRIFLKV